MFDVNVFGVIRVTQAFIRLLIAAHGKIINLGSIVGTFPAPLMGAYNASKAAVNLLSDNMRNELKPLGVDVITIFAGVVKTNLFNNQTTAKLPEGQDIGILLKILLTDVWLDSMYIPIKFKAEYVMNGGELLKGATNPKEFAHRVVNHALKKNPAPRFWYGGSSALDSKISKDSGLSELESLLAKEKGKQRSTNAH
ncbi:hypothetical protein ACHAQJ_005499 [Trichoderma viride]